MNVLNYKKPGFWVICIAIIVCVVVGICFLTNPKSTDVVEEQIVDVDEFENVPGTDTNSDMTYINTDDVGSTTEITYTYEDETIDSEISIESQDFKPTE